MAKVKIVKCPLCGWSKRFRHDDDVSHAFDAPIGDVILVEEVGGKHRRIPGELGRGTIRRRGSARGRVEILEAVSLENLDPRLRERIKQKTQKILNSIV